MFAVTEVVYKSRNEACTECCISWSKLTCVKKIEIKDVFLVSILR